MSSPRLTGLVDCEQSCMEECSGIAEFETHNRCVEECMVTCIAVKERPAKISRRILDRF